MSRLPLHTLPTFRTVARLANLRAAADQLHLTHSAVSQQIRLLEEQLGFALFDRRGRRVVLNAAGSVLLQALEPALDQIDDGVRAAAAAAGSAEQFVRVSVLPSFAQRWLLPRIGAWREHHPDISIELHASQQLVDLQRDGFHAALRQGAGPWRGLESVRLIDSPLIVVGAPAAARRLAGATPQLLAAEPLLGNDEQWNAWFEQTGLHVRTHPVANFNDAGLMLQATEQGLGIALARELLAADALRDGRLQRLSPVELHTDATQDAYWLVYPPALRDWPPVAALRSWIAAELERSRAQLPDPLSETAGTAPAGPTGSRSRARSATRERGRG